MRSPFLVYRNIDWPLAAGVLGAIILGSLAIISVDLSRGSFYLTQHQLISLVLGLGAAAFLARLHPEVFRSSSRWWYFLGLGLLVAVLVVGQVVRGTKGWFELAGFSFQPVEFVKVAVVLVLARIIDRRGRSFRTALFFFGTALVVLAPAALVLKQPDLGSALVILGLWFWMVLFVGTRRTFLLFLVMATLAVGLTGWFVFLKPYQKERLISFVDPGRDPLGAGYNVQQAIIAVGSGNFLGRGFGYGSQNQLNFVPERQTDFVFSVIGEELGFLGVLALFACYTVVGWRLIARALRARDDFSLALLIGIFGLWLVQVVVNLGGTLGMLPVTGITLPFVSYGGSSLIMNLVLLGIAESVAVNQLK